MSGPECLWRDGEHEPEEDPEELTDREADEVEEKRLQKVQGLEKPEGSTEGISFLTTCNVHDWRKKPYHINKQEVEEKIKTSCKSLLSVKEREMTFSRQRLQDMY